MSLSHAARNRVRQRANFACEYCGVSEVDSGGMLTIDHFQPKSKGGTDALSNLVYCCNRCNQFKQNYWPTSAKDPYLYNPRQSDETEHFLEMDNGHLFPLTPVGAFTIKRLRLNRNPLVLYRQQKKEQLSGQRLLIQQQELIKTLEQLNSQLVAELEEQQILLEEQKRLLNLLLRDDG